MGNMVVNHTNYFKLIMNSSWEEFDFFMTMDLNSLI